MGSVDVGDRALMLLLSSPSTRPFHAGVGGLRPVAMERTLRIIDQALGADRRATSGSRATPAATAVRRERRAQHARRGSSSSPPCCSRSRPSPPPGAATRRAAGTASRRRRRAARTPRGSSRRKPTALANAQSQIDVAHVHLSGSTPTRQRRDELADFYFRRFRPEFKPAVDAWIATRPLKNRAARRSRRSRCRSTGSPRATEAERARRAGGVRLPATGAPRHPALHELRPRRRALRGGAVLRRHERELAPTTMRRILLAIGVIVFLATLVGSRPTR